MQTSNPTPVAQDSSRAPGVKTRLYGACVFQCARVLARGGQKTSPTTPSSLQGGYRAGGRTHPPSRVASPVERHELPQGNSTYLRSSP